MDTVQLYMQKLHISREEALQLIQDDLTDRPIKEVTDLEQKAKSLKRHYETDKRNRKTPNRERKIDTEKSKILQYCATVLNDIADSQKVTAYHEQSLDFSVNGIPYTLTLVRHRTK